MKTKILLVSLLLSSTTLFAQWGLFGNAITPFQYLGTNNNQPLRIKTFGTTRMQINGNSTTPNPAGTAPFNINTNGFVGINTDKPITRLHIRGNSAATNFGGYRPWMKTGITSYVLLSRQKNENLPPE